MHINLYLPSSQKDQKVFTNSHNFYLRDLNYLNKNGLKYHNHDGFNNGHCNHRLGNIFTESELHHCTMQFQQAIKYDYDYVGIDVSRDLCQIFFEARRSRSLVLWPDGISFKSHGTSLPRYVLPNHNQLQKQVVLHCGRNS